MGASVAAVKLPNWEITHLPNSFPCLRGSVVSFPKLDHYSTDPTPLSGGFLKGQHVSILCQRKAPRQKYLEASGGPVLGVQSAEADGAFMFLHDSLTDPKAKSRAFT